MNQKGFVNIAILIIIIVLLGAGGYYYFYVNKTGTMSPSLTDKTTCKDQAMVENLKIVKSALDTYVDKHGNFPTSLSELKSSSPEIIFPSDFPSPAYLYAYHSSSPYSSPQKPIFFHLGIKIAACSDVGRIAIGSDVDIDSSTSYVSGFDGKDPVFDLATEKIKIFGSSMQPTFSHGDSLRTDYNLSQLKRGDVVAFKPPEHPTDIFIKRVVGLPGETITIANGRVIIDGKPLEESSYIKGSTSSKVQKFQMGNDQYFVLGDNREFSTDSRNFGALPKIDIVARIAGKL